MRPARLAVLPFVAALLLSGCGGGGQATRPFGPAKLVAEARAAASGQHSAHFHVVIQGTVQHRHALPAGISAGPYGLILRGAVTSDDGGRARCAHGSPRARRQDLPPGRPQGRHPG